MLVSPKIGTIRSEAHVICPITLRYVRYLLIQISARVLICVVYFRQKNSIPPHELETSAPSISQVAQERYTIRQSYLGYCLDRLKLGGVGLADRVADTWATLLGFYIWHCTRPS